METTEEPTLTMSDNPPDLSIDDLINWLIERDPSISTTNKVLLIKADYEKNIWRNHFEGLAHEFETRTANPSMKEGAGAASDA